MANPRGVRVSFIAITEAVADLERNLQPETFTVDGVDYTLDLPAVYPLPPPVRESALPFNSWVNWWDWTQGTPQPANTFNDAWEIDMVWYGRSQATEFDVGYREATAVLGAALDEFRAEEHISLGGLVDEFLLIPTDGAIGAAADANGVPRGPIIVRLRARITMITGSL